MIQITRKNYNDIPEPLTRPGTFRQIERAVVAMDGNKYNTTYYKDEVVVNKLKAFSVHKDNLDPGDRPKCYYCESYVGHVATLQVEHFRPKAKVDEIDNNSLSHPGYYWLGLEWSNLLLSCPGCNGKDAKGNRFPLVDFNNRTRPINPIRNAPLLFDRTHCVANQSPLLDEEPLIINPEYEDPTPYLTFNEVGQIRGIGEKGEKTVEILKLYRDPLFVARQAKLNEIINNIDVACAAREMGRINDDGLKVWLEAECIKILELDNVRNEYCLWGRYIIANFESCVVSKIAIYKDELRDAFQEVR